MCRVGPSLPLVECDFFFDGFDVQFLVLKCVPFFLCSSAYPFSCAQVRTLFRVLKCVPFFLCSSAYPFSCAQVRTLFLVLKCVPFSYVRQLDVTAIRPSQPQAAVRSAR